MIRALPADRPRRVLIVVHNLPVPFDRRVWLEATTLARAGHRVSVICPKAKGFTRSFEVLLAGEDPASVTDLEAADAVCALEWGPDWLPAGGVSAEAEETLAREFGLSRMTVNRALRELSDEHVLTRVQGSGTYVAQLIVNDGTVEQLNVEAPGDYKVSSAEHMLGQL